MTGQLPGLVEWSALDIVYMDFSKAFDPFSGHCSKQAQEARLGLQMEVRCAEKWLNVGSQRAVS